METKVPYLRVLETDLTHAVEMEGVLRRRRAQRSDRWKTWSAVAAALVIGAWTLGSLVNSSSDSEPTSGEFSEVGSAVNGDGGQDGPVDDPTPGSPNDSRGDDEPAEDLAKIIRDGKVAIEIPVGSFDDRFEDIVGVAEAAGGFVLASETRGPDSGTLTLRIPADRFDEALVEIRTLGEVVSSEVTGRDVTAEFIDLNARLKILRARRAVLLDLMEQADTIPETISLENHLNETQLNIEKIEGELRFLRDQVAESTLEVSLAEEGTEAAAFAGDEIENPSLTTALDRGVQGFLGVIAAVVVGLGYLLPVAAIAGVVWFSVTLVRRRGLGATPAP